MRAFSDSFFEPEVREGFYISRMMKRLWAAQLVVLSEIDAVCKKHGLRWYADNGTLLGAVRHRGYIPWDDDLDICMMRADYRKFIEIASGELPTGYGLRNIHNDPECTDLTTRVLNSDSIRLDGEFLTANGGFPYVAGVDIFPLDDLAADEEVEKKRCDRINEIDLLGKLMKEVPFGPETRKLQEKIETENHIKLGTTGVARQLNMLLENLYSMYTGADSEYVALMHYFSQDENSHKYEKRMFDTTVTLPFEDGVVNAPGMFEEVLGIEYGDFMHVVRKWDMHTYPIYALQEEMLTQAAGGTNPLKYDFCGAVASTEVMMPVIKDGVISGTDGGNVAEIIVDGAAAGKARIAGDALLGFDPYGGARAGVDPAALRGDADELVLVPAMRPEPLDEWGGKLDIALEEQILSPMMIYANRVLLDNEGLRDIYLKVLKKAAPQIDLGKKIEVRGGREATGEADSSGLTGAHEKPAAVESQSSDSARPARKRLLLYYTGISTMLAHGDDMVAKVQRSLEIMRENADAIDLVWIPQMLLPGGETNLATLQSQHPAIFGQWAKLLSENEKLLSLDLEGSIERCDAYYGDPGYPAHRCRDLGKPVMIENILI